jgi:hypothetical protein
MRNEVADSMGGKVVGVESYERSPKLVRDK